ncbi:hypothetical protein B484DRAFT_422342, partial [Ochromonadaceae sp. CCMP2298]
MHMLDSMRRGLSSVTGQEPASASAARTTCAVKVKVLENQRLDVVHSRWSFKNLTMDDPKRFFSDLGETESFPTIPLQEEWEYTGLWELDLGYPQETARREEEEEGEGHIPHPGVAGSVGGVSGGSRGGGSSGSSGGGGGGGGFMGFSPSGVLAEAADPDGPSEWVYALSFQHLLRGDIVPPQMHPGAAKARVRQRRYVRAVSCTTNVTTNVTTNITTTGTDTSMGAGVGAGTVSADADADLSEAQAAGAVRRLGWRAKIVMSKGKDIVIKGKDVTRSIVKTVVSRGERGG